MLHVKRIYSSFIGFENRSLFSNEKQTKKLPRIPDLPNMAASSASVSLIDRLRRNDASLSCLVIGSPQGTPKKDAFKIPEFFPHASVIDCYFQGEITNQT